MGKIETNLSAAEVGHHIGGAIRSGMSGRHSDVYNPATGALVARRLITSTLA